MGILKILLPEKKPKIFLFRCVSTYKCIFHCKDHNSHFYSCFLREKIEKKWLMKKNGFRKKIGGHFFSHFKWKKMIFEKKRFFSPNTNCVVFNKNRILVIVLFLAINYLNRVLLLYFVACLQIGLGRVFYFLVF